MNILDYQLPIDDIAAQKSYDYPLIKKAFDQISHASQIEFDFPQGGCQQRSHLMSMMLSKKFNIEHCKIWLFSPAALYEYETTSLFVEDKNKLSPNNIVNWNFHTAPLVKLDNGSQYDLLVIDPSLDREKPMQIDEWLKNIGNSITGKYTFLRAEKYFFNCKFNENFQLTNIFDGTFFEYSNPAKDNLVLEKGLAANDIAIFINQKYIQPLMNNLAEKDETKLIDFKEIFGNATALDLLFAQKLSGNTYNTSYRYVLAHYGDVIIEAQQLFNQRVLFWTRFTNEMMR